ncbi:MAG: DUF111 family protein, partial [Nitrospirae bacterium]|nr:DUF111 family protein [Nitrospirota bacterium]
MKESRLLFAQVDHVSGEVTGFAIGKIMEPGANNVRLIPTVTKKNRPAEPLSVDIEHDFLVSVQETLSSSLSYSISLHELRTIIESKL